MIDRWELLRWLNRFEGDIDNSISNEDGKEINRKYMEVFRIQVINMPDVKPKDRLILGFEIGLWTELVIFLIIFKITGVI